jgi:glycosyltransferase involved in cell wall biosynthesis
LLRRTDIGPRIQGVILLHLLPSFDYTAAGRQVSLLAPILSKNADVHVAALGPNGPIAESLRIAGIPIHALGSGWRFDPAAVWALRRLIRDLRPKIVHAWRLPALRTVWLARAWTKSACRLVVSEPQRGGRMTLLDRWLLRSADAFIAGHSAEANSIRGLGVAADRVHELPSTVAPPANDSPPLELTLPPGAKVVMCTGTLSPAHGFRDAICAADILRYPIPDMHLIIIGDGPDRDRLARFSLGINPAGGHAHFLPARSDAAAMLAQADVVWVPSRSECGRQVLLEAMAAGRPVVAADLPGLAALVADGRTGLLIPPGDPLGLARRTRSLLEDPELAGRLGVAGREAVAAFSPERVAPAYAELYQRIL